MQKKVLKESLVTLHYKKSVEFIEVLCFKVGYWSINLN